ncbi:MAG: ribbon-helix-helix protein, CopG family [Candidatus Aminicenantes bacterium]|nr:ribbon-helix-helix protein, CopG family [Candidatus Aminicenantes bacterium]
MSEQMLIRLDSELKEKLLRIARREGKSASGAVREMIAKYVLERDIGAHIDELWGRVGSKLVAKGANRPDVERTIQEVRRERS